MSSPPGSAAPLALGVLGNDAVLAGLLLLMLGAIFWTSSQGGPRWQRFYRYVPMLLVCYFLPSLLTTLGWVDPQQSSLYFFASRYLLPTSLVFLTLSIDLRELFGLGPKALVMFLTGTAGVVIGGPLALVLVSTLDPSVVQDSPQIWRGLASVAGSWIGGGANQAAMKEVFLPSDALFSVMVTVDIVVAELWMCLLLLGVARSTKIDQWTGADTSKIEALVHKMTTRQAGRAKVPSTTDTMVLLATGFGVCALSHALADAIAPWVAAHAPQLASLSLDSKFFWLIVLATTFGVALSFTRARHLEDLGASRLGSVAVFFLIATIGLNMDIRVVTHHPKLFLVGGVWMSIHVLLLVLVGYAIKAPFFFLAVGSKANIGGAASAPVVAAAFHPALAPVGVLLAVFGYALGTYGAWLCAVLMRMVC